MSSRDIKARILAMSANNLSYYNIQNYLAKVYPENNSIPNKNVKNMLVLNF